VPNLPRVIYLTNCATILYLRVATYINDYITKAIGNRLRYYADQYLHRKSTSKLERSR